MSYPDDLPSEVAQGLHDVQESGRRDSEAATHGTLNAGRGQMGPPLSLEEQTARNRWAHAAQKEHNAFMRAAGCREIGGRWVYVGEGEGG